jgi:hypothetical protein
VSGLICVVMLLWSGAYLRAYARGRQALSGSRVREAAGEVAWEPPRYVARLGGPDGQRLRAWNRSDIECLVPGAHRFHCLDVAGTGWLLSAEDAGSGGPGASTTGADGQQLRPLREILAQTNGFSVDALESNRRGRLTQAQRDALLAPADGAPARGAPREALRADLDRGTVAMVDGTAEKLEAPRRSLADAALSVALDVVQNAAFEAAFGTTGGAGTRGGGAASGSPDMGRMDADASTVYLYLVGDRRFAVPWLAYRALVEGVRYRLYYLPASGVLVNVEPVAVEGAAST